MLFFSIDTAVGGWQKSTTAILDLKLQTIDLIKFINE